MSAKTTRPPPTRSHVCDTCTSSSSVVRRSVRQIATQPYSGGCQHRPISFATVGLALFLAVVVAAEVDSADRATFLGQAPDTFHETLEEGRAVNLHGDLEVGLAAPVRGASR